MKAIMISIKPKYVAKILNGEKTIEIRKTMPKCDLPIDVYIYCTKDKKYSNLINRGGFLTGMVVAKFTLNKCQDWHFYSWQEITKKGCVSDQELQDYGRHAKTLYIWEIDNLVIFDEPKELNDFMVKPTKRFFMEHTEQTYGILGKGIFKDLTKAPQSWCYVEVER